MSGGAAGKFQDHYSILGVAPDADLETIRAACDRLTEKFSGEETKVDALKQAYEVLSDPDLRAAFDKVKGVDIEVGGPKFSGAEFFQALEQSAGLRAAVLSILYDRRRVKSFKPSLSMRHMDAMVNVSGEALNFALWYLKKRGFVTYDDKSSMEITVEGMDFLEQNRPVPEIVMRFIKQESVAKPLLDPLPLAEVQSAEPLVSVLSRVLRRNDAPEESRRR
jgi:hypothetical protein